MSTTTDFPLITLQKTQHALYNYFPPSPQYFWPQLKDRLGFDVCVKHENHLPVGSFKLRGALAYLLNLKEQQPDIHHVVAASRGNFGQGIAFSAQKLGLKATIVVPENNSPDKNRAMRLLGAELIEHGKDFQTALEFSQHYTQQHQAHYVPSYSPALLAGTASIGLELFGAYPDLDVVYSSIGLGSNICGLIAARDAMGLNTKIIGVVTDAIPAYAESFKAGTCIASPAGPVTIADGLDCRIPNPQAFEMILSGLERVITVSEHDIACAMRIYFEDTHNIAEGAGAAPLAGLIQEKALYNTTTKSAVILCGGNVALDKYFEIIHSAK